jgi:hypothetical protein
MAKIKEVDLFAPLNKYFSALGYTVNTEVENKWGYKRADILVTKDSEDTKNNEIIGIETKTNLSFELLDQGNYWRRFTDYNYVCVPVIKGDRPKVVYPIISNLGFGLIEVNLNTYHRFYDDLKENEILYDDTGHIDIWRLGLNFTVLPKANHPVGRDKNALRSVIYEEHQHWAVGGQQANKTYVSGYKLLMYDVYSYMRKMKKEHPESDGWVSLNDIVDYLEEHSNNVVRNHYKNMKSGIRQAFEKFEVSDIEKLNLGGRNTVYKVMDESTKYLDMDKR